MIRFRGTFSHNIDSKGRLSVPNKFRDILRAKEDSRLVVTKDLYQDCLLVFPLERWQEAEERVDELPTGQERDNFVRRFVSPAQDCAMDKMGRILIPATLREEVGLGREVMVVGALGKFEIWDKAGWDSYSRDQTVLDNARELVKSQNIKI